MENKFCDNCNNSMYVYLDSESSKLYLYRVKFPNLDQDKAYKYLISSAIPPLSFAQEPFLFSHI